MACGVCIGRSSHEAQRLAATDQWHYTPKHGSWLNMAEIELSVLARQCLQERMESQQNVEQQVLSWHKRRNAQQVKSSGVLVCRTHAANSKGSTQNCYPVRTWDCSTLSKSACACANCACAGSTCAPTVWMCRDCCCRSASRPMTRDRQAARRHAANSHRHFASHRSRVSGPPPRCKNWRRGASA